MPLIDGPLTPRPKLKLSRLRDIGWSIWDPIGLMGSKSNWDDEDCQSFADEYDNYLMQAAGQLLRGVADSQVVEYLVQIESEHMGLGVRTGSRARAEQVVAAIHSDKEIWTRPQ